MSTAFISTTCVGYNVVLLLLFFSTHYSYFLLWTTVFFPVSPTFMSTIYMYVHYNVVLLLVFFSPSVHHSIL